MVLTGLAYLAQGWIVGSEGFSQTMSMAIVLAEILGVTWMTWLLIVAWRMGDLESSRSSDEGPAATRPFTSR
jgi:hypothetical protein